jgi:TldD protein
MNPIQVKQLLNDVIKNQSDYVELRWHRRTANQFLATKGRVDVANQSRTEGVGVRAFIQGAWGFAATANVTPEGVRKAIDEARRNAKIIAQLRQDSKSSLSSVRLSTQDFVGDGFKELTGLKVTDKLGKVIDIERELQSSSQFIQTARVRYTEYLEEKAIVTTDGANCTMQIAQPELSLSAIAENAGDRSTYHKGAGVSGGWTCLFKHPSLDHVVNDVAKISVDLLKAKYPEGGKKTCILGPAVVGLLSHEAIGHTVEADFVKSGSVAQGKIGQMVASPLVTLADTGCETTQGYAMGNLPFDDEGVETENTIIIKNGILNSYLHSRESAAEFGVKPTGNARAWLYNDEPLIRMRNTYILPGKQKLENMIAEINDGYLIEGAGSGQADANGEFMFGSSYVWHIKNGKRQTLLKEATMSGIAFDVLKTVDAVSEEFKWDSGTGHCGKGQPAKVDAGGPYIRCQMNLGGRQS